MRIGLIDVDGHNFPNLPLMKLSAWHKKQGDEVRWYNPWDGFLNPYDKVYMSKVFSFTPDYDSPVYATEIVKGGSGYCIELVDGKEVYHAERDQNLPYEIEHIYPDYSTYPELTKDTAYGFLTRGCPRGCDFCHVKSKEGLTAYKVADLDEFWNGQKNICLCDPNILACKDRVELLHQLQDSKARIEFNQGLDIRLMTEEIALEIAKLKINSIHFAWDRYEDKEIVQPRFKAFKECTQIDYRKLTVYVLVGDRERRVLPEDLERVYWLRDNGYTPYVMVYNKSGTRLGTDIRNFERWVNHRWVFRACERFEDYVPGKRKEA